MTSQTNATPVLVFVHPAWPWRFTPKTRYDRQLRVRFEAMIHAAMVHRGPVILVDEESEVLPGPIVQRLDRLRTRADFVALDVGDDEQSLRSAGAQAAKHLKKKYADRSVIIGGFYRNLCVKTVRESIPHARVERSICPGRIIY